MHIFILISILLELNIHIYIVCYINSSFYEYEYLKPLNALLKTLVETTVTIFTMS